MSKTLNSKNLIMHLIKYGYRYCKPKCNTWKSAFIFKYQNSLICILFRKNGVDIRYYDKYNNEILIDEHNNMSMHGGELFRNHYNESHTLINNKIKAICADFTKGLIAEEIRIQDGRSYLLNAEYKNIREESKKKFYEKYNELKENASWRGVIESMRESGGYLTDGIWI